MKKISLRLPNDIFENLSEEAANARISISDVIREKILKCEDSKSIVSLRPETDQNLQNQIVEILKQTAQNEKAEPSSDPAMIEILFLLRELLLQREGGILRKVDLKLDRLFGKERKKIL